MGVTYKLTDEVVHFIINQRQSNPLFSCRQLAESASQEFGLNLSKSSVHDVLKESGIITPRGRKPKPKFQIPQDKKKQIQVSLSQVKLISPPPVIPAKAGIQNIVNSDMDPRFGGDDDKRNEMEISAEYEEAGKIFLKAALWDLGIFSEEHIKGMDWDYYLTYSRGIKVVLENNKDFFIDLLLPVERCIREAADGLINNIKPLIVHKVSDEILLKSCMDAQPGHNIKSVSIVSQNGHVLFEFSNIMEYNRSFTIKNRLFVESKENNMLDRAKILFISQAIENNNVLEGILKLKGFDSVNKDENIITLLIDDIYNNKAMVQEAAERLNGMCLRDEQDRLVKVRIQYEECHPRESGNPKQN